MKIYNLGLRVQAGKYKYRGEYFDKLLEKFQPQKSTPYSVEITDSDSQTAEVIIYLNQQKLDLVVSDLEKIETRLGRSDDSLERRALTEAQRILEKEALLCDSDLDEEIRMPLKTLGLLTLKPCLGRDDVGDIDALIGEALEKAKIVLFFTVGKKEVRIWSVQEGESILEAAGQIHSDLRRGFIKADVVNCSQLDNFFNMAEARSRGFVQVVDRDYVMQPNDIIEVRFNV